MFFLINRQTIHFLIFCTTSSGIKRSIMLTMWQLIKKCVVSEADSRHEIKRDVFNDSLSTAAREVCGVYVGNY